ncbi:MAG: cytochrome c oxidase subunit II [Rhodospirillales bacterium]|nr:cytochrome c oxidase subunit II [Rhodospirillales bacterium]
MVEALWARRWPARIVASGLFLLLLGLCADPAFAAEPHPWQMGMQPPATPVSDRIHALHNLLLVIITLISLFVLALLCYVMWRYNEKRNPTPSRTTHNTMVEVLWTVIPVVILVIIAIPSFGLLYYMDKTQEADMTIKVTGRQWYWTYEYPDHDNITFDSTMVPQEDLQPGQRRLLEVDNQLVVPVNTNIRVLVAGSDVMHSWFVPSLGVQMYAVIGRLNETWMNIEKEGTYYGQCNQICGVNHAFMPISVRAVSKEEFARWVEEAKTKFAKKDETAPIRVANAAK